MKNEEIKKPDMTEDQDRYSDSDFECYKAQERAIAASNANTRMLLDALKSFDTAIAKCEKEG